MGSPEAAREVLLGLDKSLRVHRLYDHDNEMVVAFVEQFESQLHGYLSEHGDFTLGVRPASFDIDGEAVPMSGLDEFALGLFRQGIISLRINYELRGDDLRRFLIILSDGLKQTDYGDDDLVTLLWNAELPGVTYASVLGYQEAGAEDDDELVVDPDCIGETLNEALRADLQQASAAAQQALAAHGERLRGAQVPAELSDFVAEVENESSQQIHDHVIEVMREVLTLPEGERHLDETEAEQLLATVLDLLLTVGEPESLAQFAREVAELAKSHERAHSFVAQRFAANGLTDDHLHRWLQSLPGGPQAHAETVTTVIDILAKDRKELIADLADVSEAPDSRRVFNQVLSGMCDGNADFLVNRFRALNGVPAVDALESLFQVQPDVARQAMAVRLPGADPETQAALLQALCSIEGLYDHRVRASLVRLATREQRLRAMVVATFVKLDDREIIDTLWQWARSDDLGQQPPETIRAIISGLLCLADEEQAIEFAGQLLSKRALIRRRALVTLKEAVIEALADVTTARSLALLEQHAASGDKLIREACKVALSKAAERARAENPSPSGRR